MREQTWRLVLAAGALTVAAFGAEAVPITSVHFGEGTLTAKLELWQEDETNNFSVSLLEQFSLGVDYNVAVPQTFLNAKLPWQAEIAPTYHGYPAQFIAADVHLPQQLSVNETTVETLDEWCGPHTRQFLDGAFVLGRRGTCAFADKAANLAASNAAAAILVNQTPTTPLTGIGLGTAVPDIPIVLLTYERGAQILAMINTFQVAPHFYPLLHLEARWDPDVVTEVPEPGTLALFCSGLAFALVATARRRRILESRALSR